MTPATSAPGQPATPKTEPPAPRKKSRLKWWLLAGGLLLAALLAAVVVKRRSSGAATVVTTEKAVLRTITQIVSATGKIQPEVEVKISAEVAGEILELPLKDGAPVQKGMLLVRIKPDNLQAQVEQQEASLADAKARSVLARAQLQKAGEDFRRSADLFGKQLISESEHLRFKTELDVAQANLDASLAQIRRSDGLLKQARDQLAKTTIYAPIDGTVSSRTSEVGERVVATNQFAGTEIMRVADLTNMEVRVNINENDIVNVKVGDKARVTIDAFPNRKFDAVVKEIGSAAKMTGQGTQDEVTNFQVKIRILDKDVPLRPGMSANADVETQTVENVVAVPIQSVTVRAKDGGKSVGDLAADRRKDAGETKGDGPAAENEKQQRQKEKADREKLNRVVFVRTGETVKLVPVETGIADTTHMEIKSGVKEGDEIVSGSFSAITRTLKDGMKVRLQPKKKDKAATK